MAMRSVASVLATSSGWCPSIVKATVGVRSSIVVGPHTVTPSMAFNASSSGANTAASLAASTSSPTSRRKAAAASMAAMASKLGVPVSHRRGPRSAAGRTLATGSSSSSAGSAHSTPACGPYHLYGLVTRTSQPMASTSILRCGARCTASTNTRAPASWAAATMGATSGIVPSRLDAPVTATHRVCSSIRSATAAGSRRPVCGSNGASTCSAPAWSQARRHGVTLAS